MRTMNMTLKPTNLLHLCDDIQEKIGEEIKCIRIEKDAKKRREFLHTYIIMARICREMTLGRIVEFCNAVIKFDFEEETHDKIHDNMETNNGPLFFVKTMGVFYTQIKEKLYFTTYKMK